MSLLATIGLCVLILGVQVLSYRQGYRHGYEEGESAEWWRNRPAPDGPEPEERA